MRVHVCVYINVCAFFCIGCCVHFGTGVLGTSAGAEVYVTQVFFFTLTYTSENTLAEGCAHVCICIYMCICMHMYVDTYMRL